MNHPPSRGRIGSGIGSGGGRGVGGMGSGGGGRGTGGLGTGSGIGTVMMPLCQRPFFLFAWRIFFAFSNS